ncbi:hypothetical protein KJ564_04990 [bacterium]|nr:hypothetical protein [bacterium]MBU1880791.1 hypothetical protein [bacterium]
MRTSLLLLFLLPSLASAQEEFVITIETTLGDTTETFWLQIPADYNPASPCPLLVGWHQWGGDHLEFRDATNFDAIADQAGWIAASHFGAGYFHWNNHATQSHVVDMIAWIAENYSIDADRIYMVGASMGGAAAMIFSNNHLDPDGPMVAAAASVSGIQDCERRFYEQGVNHTMIQSFGGTPDQVPFEYHRNSAIYFADSTESMHFNARHLPLALTFGAEWSDSVWRCHAEDLYTVMEGFADSVVLFESSLYGHGWGASEDLMIYNFLSGFTLKRYPTDISINADAEGDWYWAELTLREPLESFARFDASFDSSSHPPAVHVDFINNVASAALDLPSLGYDYDSGNLFCYWNIDDALPAELSFIGISEEPYKLLKNSFVTADWSYDAGDQSLTLYSDASAAWTIVLDASTNHPNLPEKHPFPPITTSQNPLTLHFGLPGNAPVTWSLYNVLGQQIERRILSGGLVRLPRHLPSGLYLGLLESTNPAYPRHLQKIILTR